MVGSVERTPLQFLWIALLCAGCGLGNVGADKDAWQAAQDAAQAGDNGSPDEASVATDTSDDGTVEDALTSDMAGVDAADGQVQDGATADAGDDVLADSADGDASPEDVPPPECVTDTECKGEASVCAAWQCQAGSCVLAKLPNGSSCTNPDLCETWTCQEGTCTLLKSKNCTDGNPCTKGSCLADKGTCVHLPTTATCTDGDKCTVDACEGGACAGTPSDCSDGDPCSDDHCLPAKGCVHTANTAPCSDGNPCSVVDTCAAGKCAGKAALLTSGWNPGGLARWVHALPTDDGGAIVLGDVTPLSKKVSKWFMRRLNAAGDVMAASPLIDAKGIGMPALVTVDGGDVLLVGSGLGEGKFASHCRGARVSPTGKLVWLKTWPGEVTTRCEGAVTRGDGKHMLVGASNSKGGEAYRPRILLVDSAGKVEQEANSLTHAFGLLHAAVAAPGGETVACGYRSLHVADTRSWVLGLDASLKPLWQRNPGPFGTGECHSLARTKEGRIVGVGTSGSVFALNAKGGLLWKTWIPGLSGLWAVDVGPDGDVYTAGLGEFPPPANLIRLSASGRLLFNKADVFDGHGAGWLGLRRLVGGRLLLLGFIGEDSLYMKARGVLRWADTWGHATCAEAGKCAPQLGNGCGDGNPCTDDLCDPSSGCQGKPHADACDDGKTCTSGAACKGGSCQAGPPRLWRHVYDKDDSQLIDGLPLVKNSPIPALTSTPDGGWATVSRVKVAGKGLEARLDRFGTDASQPLYKALHGGPGDQTPMAIAGAPGGFVVGGATTSGKAWLLFVDNKLASPKAVGVTAGAAATLVDLKPIENDVTLAVGRSWASVGQQGPAKILLVRAQSAGVQSQVAFGAGVSSLLAARLAVVGSGVTVVAGERVGAGGQAEVLLAKVSDATGVIWQRGLASSAGPGATRSLAGLPDGGFLVGTTVLGKGKVALPAVLRTTRAGLLVWQWQFGGNKGWVHGHLSAMVARSDGSAGIMAVVGNAGGPANVPAWMVVAPGGDASFQELSLFGVNVPGAATLTAEQDTVIAVQTEPKGPGKHYLSLMRLDGWGRHDCKVSGVCGDLSPTDCAPGLPCLSGSCDPVKGCTPWALSACDDGLHCSLNDGCVGGVCKPGAKSDCDDKDPCTKDACSDVYGCQHTLSEGAPCEDGQFCTTKETCKGGACQGEVLTCDDGHTCTADSCDEKQDGCLHKPDKAKCNDANVCTSDACDVAKGCVHPAVTMGSSCGAGKVCSGATCTVPWAVSVAVGKGFSCALHPGGKVSCWGDDKLGQLGTGGGAPSAKPVLIPTVKGAAHLSAGQDNVCVSESASGPVCWGSNAVGQSLPGNKQAISKPTMFYGKKIEALALSDRHGCALYAGGLAGCWGHDRGGTFGNPSTSGKTQQQSAIGVAFKPIKGISAAFGTTCIRVTGGAVWCTGSSALVGNKDAPKGNTKDFMKVIGPDGQPLTGVTSMVGNTLYTVAMNSAGKALAWGQSHPFGGPWKADRANLLQLPGKVLSMAGGAQHACFALADGHVWCQGSSKGTWLGDPGAVVKAEPMKVPGLAQITALGANDDHTCALRADGAVLCWGANHKGQCGTGAVTPYSKPSPVAGSAPDS